MVKNLPARQRDLDLIPGLGRSPGGGHGNPLQYSCLENPRRQRNLVGYSPWGRKELDSTERLSTVLTTWLVLCEHFQSHSNSYQKGTIATHKTDQRQENDIK